MDSESQKAYDDDRRDEVARHPIYDPLNRGVAALGLADHAHDLGEERVGADLLGADEQPTRAVDRGGDDLAAGLLLGWDRLA